MFCPKCGYSEGNHIKTKKTDEEFFLESMLSLEYSRLYPSKKYMVLGVRRRKKNNGYFA